MRRGEVVIRPPDGTLPGVDSTLAAVDGVSRDAVTAMQWGADGALTLIYRLSTDGVATGAVVADALRADPDVETHEVVEERGDLYAFVHTESSPMMAGLLATVDREPVLLEAPFRCDGDGWRFTVVGPESALQRVHGLASGHVPLDVDRLHTYRPSASDALAGLTERQREALECAHTLGFYDRSDGASFEEVAAALECSTTAANELVRRAEAHIVDRMLSR